MTATVNTLKTQAPCTATAQNIITALAAVFLLFAPFVRGGKTSTALLTLELLGLCILLIIFWNGLHKQRFSKSVWGFIILGFLSIVVYLIPLPESLWNQLAGREHYVAIAQWLEANSDYPVYPSLSLVPINTLGLLLTCIPALAIFLAFASVSRQRQVILIYAFLGCALYQSILGMLQYFTRNPIYQLGTTAHNAGTYLNQNHLTAFVEMAEPLALALMIYALIDKANNTWQKTTKALLFGIISLALTFIPLISSSRTGTVLLLVSIFLSFWVMTTPGIRKQVMGPIIALRLVLLGIAVVIQLGVLKTVSNNLVAGMEPKAVLGDLRWQFWNNGWQGIQDFAPFGSGPSTLQSAYQAYQEDTLKLFVNHLHNDYIQLVFEWGVLGVLLIIGFISVYALQWRRLKHQHDEKLKLFQAGAGIGIFLFLLFSITEFNLHTPANVFFLAFLCGVFFCYSGGRRPEQVN